MRIGSSLSGIDLAVQHRLQQAFALLDQSGLRLSTMRRINRAADDPAGMIAAAELESQLTALEQASSGAGRVAGAIHVADAAMAQVSELLNSIQGNVVAAAGGNLSDAEVAAHQLEVDAALEAIDRIGNTTSFGGRKLLDGTGVLTVNTSADLSSPATLTLPAITTTSPGGSAGHLSDLASGGSASLTSGHLDKAVEILDAARGEVLEARAQAGAFEKYTIQSSQDLFASMEVNLSSALSEIQDTDVAEETSRLVRSQLLVRSALSSLLFAGARHEAAATLLGGG